MDWIVKKEKLYNITMIPLKIEIKEWAIGENITAASMRKLSLFDGYKLRKFRVFNLSACF